MGARLFGEGNVRPYARSRTLQLFQDAIEAQKQMLGNIVSFQKICSLRKICSLSLSLSLSLSSEDECDATALGGDSPDSLA